MRTHLWGAPLLTLSPGTDLGVSVRPPAGGIGQDPPLLVQGLMERVRAGAGECARFRAGRQLSVAIHLRTRCWALLSFTIFILIRFKTMLVSPFPTCPKRDSDLAKATELIRAQTRVPGLFLSPDFLTWGLGATARIPKQRTREAEGAGEGVRTDGFGWAGVSWGEGRRAGFGQGAQWAGT